MMTFVTISNNFQQFKIKMNGNHWYIHILCTLWLYPTYRCIHFIHHGFFLLTGTSTYLEAAFTCNQNKGIHGFWCSKGKHLTLLWASGVYREKEREPHRERQEGWEQSAFVVSGDLSQHALQNHYKLGQETQTTRYLSVFLIRREIKHSVCHHNNPLSYLCH